MVGRVFTVPYGTTRQDPPMTDAQYASRVDNSCSIAEAYAYGARCRSNSARAAFAAAAFGIKSRGLGSFVHDGGPLRERRVIGKDLETGRKCVSFKL